MPAGVVTVTSTMPEADSGVTTVMELEDLTVKLTAVEPKLTLVAPMKLLPLSVTAVHPPEGPCAGVTLLTAAGGGVPAPTVRAVPMLVPLPAKMVSATT